MNAGTAQLNLVVAWGLIALGFLLGSILGLNFDRETWLGGYATLKRRLYRLAHISIFALAMINLLFYFTVQLLAEPSLPIAIASWGFIIGAVTMPCCCFAMAHFPKLRALFSIPVVSLIGAGILTLWEVLKL